MPSKREKVLSMIFSRLGAITGASVLRGEVLPVRIPDGGLIILRDGDMGEPDVTLNPRTEYYRHRIPIEVISGGDDTALDELLITVGLALATDPTLGGLVELLEIGAPEVGVTPIEGGPTLRHAIVTVVAEYQVNGPLAAE